MNKLFIEALLEALGVVTLIKGIFYFITYLL